MEKAKLLGDLSGFSTVPTTKSFRFAIF